MVDPKPVERSEADDERDGGREKNRAAVRRKIEETQARRERGPQRDDHRNQVVADEDCPLLQAAEGRKTLYEEA